MSVALNTTEAEFIVAVEGCLPESFAAARRSFLLRGWLLSSSAIFV